MSFQKYFMDYTGMTIEENFRLIWGPFTKERVEQTARDIMKMWIDDEKPAQDEITKAEKLIEEYI